MAFKTKKEVPSFNFKTFTSLVRFSFYSAEDKRQFFKMVSLETSLLFFVINISIAFLLKSIIASVLFRQAGLVLLQISQLIFLIPLVIGGLFLLSFLFYITNKGLQTSCSYTDNLKVLTLSSFPLIFTAIPFIGFFPYMLVVYFLILNFYAVFHQSKLNALINIAIPCFAIALLVVTLAS